jgi:hypothetical protein
MFTDAFGEGTRRCSCGTELHVKMKGKSVNVSQELSAFSVAEVIYHIHRTFCRNGNCERPPLADITALIGKSNNRKSPGSTGSGPGGSGKAIGKPKTAAGATNVASEGGKKH